MNIITALMAVLSIVGIIVNGASIVLRIRVNQFEMFGLDSWLFIISIIAFTAAIVIMAIEAQWEQGEKK